MVQPALLPTWAARAPATTGPAPRGHITTIRLPATTSAKMTRRLLLTRSTTDATPRLLELERDPRSPVKGGSRDQAEADQHSVTFGLTGVGTARSIPFSPADPIGAIRELKSEQHRLVAVTRGPVGRSQNFDWSRLRNRYRVDRERLKQEPEDPERDFDASHSADAKA